ncbi:flavin reductase, partial [Streptomyces massasporeus]
MSEETQEDRETTAAPAAAPSRRTVIALGGAGLALGAAAAGGAAALLARDGDTPVPVADSGAARTPLMPPSQKDNSMTVTPDLRPGTVPTIGAPRQASPDLLRSVFRRHAAGVAVVTAHGERPVGFTATSLNSVAAEPPLISFGVGTTSSSWPVLAEAEHIGVHILGEHQQELAATFARSGADRFGDELGYRPNLTARHLRKGRTGIIAFAVPELGNPYFAELAGAIIDAAAQHDYTVLVDHTAGLRERELLVCQEFRSHVIDG